MSDYNIGSAIYFQCTVRNLAGILVNPTTITCDIYYIQQDGTRIFITSLNVNAVSTGIFSAVWQSSSSDRLGRYIAEWKASDGVNVAIERASFVLT